MKYERRHERGSLRALFEKSARRVAFLSTLVEIFCVNFYEIISITFIRF